jgi:Xaa-Pro aminopeptidase
MDRIAEIQQALRAAQLDGWLFYDFHNRDLIAYRILGLDAAKTATRRWYYFVPAQGQPRKLCHSVEPFRLDALPGEKKIYLPWQQMQARLKELLGDAKRVAMQYSPNCLIPYVSLADAGTVELVRSFGVEIVSSADLVQRFEAYVDAKAFETHLEGGRRMHAILDATWAEIARRVKTGTPTELEIQQHMLELYAQHGMAWHDKPIVAVGPHAADPHFEPRPDNTVPIKPGDRVLIDLWAKVDAPGAIYFDITWMGYVGREVPEDSARVFATARDARDAGVKLIEERVAAKSPVAGWEVDRVVRGHIEAKGYGQYFVHRTGHCIGEEVHGNGANIDNLETKDERKLVPGTLFSIEPGIYLPDEGMGVRLEIDVVLTPEGPRIFSKLQQELVRLA